MTDDELLEAYDSAVAFGDAPDVRGLRAVASKARDGAPVLSRGSELRAERDAAVDRAEKAEACVKLAAEQKRRVTAERDQLARALTALGLRACDAHAAVYRAMLAAPAEAHAACQDGGYLHEAAHACLPAQALPDAVPALAARLDDEVRRHVEALGERALRAERKRDAWEVEAKEAQGTLGRTLAALEAVAREAGVDPKAPRAGVRALRGRAERAETFARRWKAAARHLRAHAAELEGKASQALAHLGDIGTDREGRPVPLVEAAQIARGCHDFERGRAELAEAEKKRLRELISLAGFQIAVASTYLSADLGAPPTTTRDARGALDRAHATLDAAKAKPATYLVEGPGLRVEVPAATVGGGGERQAVRRAVREAWGARAEGAPGATTVVACNGRRFEVGRKLSGFAVVGPVDDAGSEGGES